MSIEVHAVSKSSGSQQMVKTIVRTIPMHNPSPDLATDVLVQSNDLYTIAELLYHIEIVALN